VLCLSFSVGASYGNGVYFATNPRYSHNYGNGIMLMNKVLTGTPMPGKAGLNVLDPGHDSATDDINNPTMFVVFGDSQAYHEYLIEY